ncbi:MAG: deoxynucleoside kinase [archaeon]|nr:MAG: deoxynucleoside kinase [archaeon]
MTFVVLEGFSGSGKTTLARGLETKGWVRLPESAHAVPASVPVGEGADTYSDLTLFGSTMSYCSAISRLRTGSMIVSEGYLLSDLAYARIRYDLGKSRAYPGMLAMCKSVLSEPAMVPDLYVLLEARPETIGRRQAEKDARERNQNSYFRRSYYDVLTGLHEDLAQTNVERLLTDRDHPITLTALVSLLKRKGLGLS